MDIEKLIENTISNIESCKDEYYNLEQAKDEEIKDLNEQIARADDKIEELETKIEELEDKIWNLENENE